MKLRWVTFDCYGTLVDWRGGFEAILRPIFGLRTADVIAAYHSCERELQRAEPHPRYRDVLGTGLFRAAASLGLSIAENQARVLPERWGELAVFDDVEPMLAALRDMGCQLGVLTNCDNDLFAQTERLFRRPFDRVVTAEQVRSYKPSLAHFRRFAELSGVAPGEWVHVACSGYHDLAPTAAMGIPRIWLDRERAGEDQWTFSARVPSAAEVPAAIRRL